MLWKKESNRRIARGNQMYIDLFESTSSVDRQYQLNIKNRREYNSTGEFRKNGATAKLFRMKGNAFFKKHEFTAAMELYNKSLCFAEKDSEAIGMAYANRSTCFMKLNMFKKCLADIELAKQNKCPAQLMKKLDERKLECLKLMESKDDQGEISEAKLDFDPNEMFPCLANVLDIRSNVEYARHLLAMEDIEVGKTVVAEQCYIGVTKGNLYASCNICLKGNQNLIPCEKCTSALFCSDCKENDLHGIECNITSGCPPGDTLMDLVRSISLVKNAFASADELIAYVEDMLRGNALELPSNLVDERSKYRTFFELCPNWKRFQLTLEQTFLFYRLLLEQGSMNAFFRSKAHKRFLMHLIQHHIFMIIYGSFNKRVAPIGGESITDTYINLIAKHLKYSLNPNVRVVCQDGYTRCIVIRPIKKNEPLSSSCRTVRSAEEISKADCNCEVCMIIISRLEPDRLEAFFFSRMLRDLNLFSKKKNYK